MKKRFLIITWGKEKAWSFMFMGDDRHLDDWLEDGLEVYEVVNTVPMWAVNLGLTRIWILAQDIFNFRFLK